jgi:uncharacterized protein (TIGR02246 family)
MSNRIPIPTMKPHRNILIAVSLFFALAASPPASAASACTPQQRSQILALFEQWDRSLATGNAATVDANYARDAILIPTLSNEIRRDPARRIAYFRDDFLPERPHGRLNHAYVRCFGDIAINSGIYTFTFGNGSRTQARYTFVYQRQSNGGWLIIEHHSSKMPRP